MFHLSVVCAVTFLIAVLDMNLPLCAVAFVVVFLFLRLKSPREEFKSKLAKLDWMYVTPPIMSIGLIEVAVVTFC